MEGRVVIEIAIPTARDSPGFLQPSYERSHSRFRRVQDVGTKLSRRPEQQACAETTPWRLLTRIDQFTRSVLKSYHLYHMWILGALSHVPWVLVLSPHHVPLAPFLRPHNTFMINLPELLEFLDKVVYFAVGCWASCA